MRSGEEEIVRWRDQSMDPSALPARAADLLDAARDVPALPLETLGRIFANLEGPARQPPRLRGLPLGLRLATLMALLLTSVATAKGAIALWHRYVAAPAPAVPHRAGARPTLAAAPAPKPRVETSPLIVAIDEVAPTPEMALEPSDEASLAPDKAQKPRSRRAPAPQRRPSAEEAPDPANEAQLLADALARLRQTHDPRGALALLDQYAKAYPRGVLALEARSARLEAMLKLDDRKGALALLDDRATFAGRLGAEQLLTRAELRASVGRYTDALEDFDRLLGPSSATLGAARPADLERALYGRAVTLGHLGRDDQARIDLEACRRRFPSGKHAPEVARLLKGAPRDRR